MCYAIKLVRTGLYVQSYDFDADFGVFTPDRTEAKRFSNKLEALCFWQTQSRARPYNGDGKPNRPLINKPIHLEEVVL